ncbi:MAG: SDR family NAD(P)-dependent oxidoreductase, partial [Gammaproteobacteria bacterium]|nr:SDR family NAD(P)-dependent oxidoreductase [Gammaproteobacteria bacterium]
MKATDDDLHRILLIGATSAIGGALAEIYARHGVVLYLHGRNEERLTEVASRCRAKGTEVVTHLLDVRDFTAMQGWLRTLDALDLVIITAGINTHIGPAGEPEPWDRVEALMDVNLKAAMVIVQSVLPAMRARGRGQIALFSSLAAYFGLPVTPSYCASKAAIKAYGEALRGWLGPQGIRINVIMPGYVKSPMCDEMPGPK